MDSAPPLPCPWGFSVDEVVGLTWPVSRACLPAWQVKWALLHGAKLVPVVHKSLVGRQV